MHALFSYPLFMDRKRGVQRVSEVIGDHVLKQAGNDHKVWGAGPNNLFMDPSGPLWPLGIHQTDANREGGRMGRKVGEERGIEKRILKNDGGFDDGTQMEGR